MTPRYALRLVMRFAQYPAALYALPKGPEAVGGRLLDLIAAQYLANPKEEIKLKGFVMHLNTQDGYISGQIYREGMCEPDVSPYFEHSLASADTVFDVGANIGWYTLLAASLLRGRGKVFSFEPEPHNFDILSRSVLDNNFSNVQLNNVAVSDTEGTADLHISPQAANPGLHSLVYDFGTRSIKVPTITLDRYAQKQEIDRIDIVKIDVEGWEPEVLKGGMGLLENNKISEIFLEWVPERWTDDHNLSALLLRKYYWYELRWGSKTPILKNFPKSRTNVYLKLR